MEMSKEIACLLLGRMYRLVEYRFVSVSFVLYFDRSCNLSVLSDNERKLRDK